MNRPAIKAGYPRNYEANVLPGLPTSGPEPLDFRATPHGRGREGFVVEVRLGNERWVGNFQRGDGKLSGIYPTPSSGHVCVIASGRGYWVSTSSPARYDIVEAYPVQDVLTIPDLLLLIFVDYTALAAYGPDGLRWRSSRVSWDGIRISHADANGIEGRGWDASTEQEVGFFVHTVTGRAEGGAAPPSTSDGPHNGAK